MLKDDRKNALNAAKSTVNAYAKDPTEAPPIWRQRLEIWLRSYPGSDDDLK